MNQTLPLFGGMGNEHLEYVFVPLGLLVFFLYHMWLLFTILREPHRTVIGLNAESRHQWVQAMMSDPFKNGVLAVQTIRNNIMASTLLATTAITLSSLIGIFASSSWSSDDTSSILHSTSSIKLTLGPLDCEHFTCHFLSSYGFMDLYRCLLVAA
ncbi:hypothetical protein L195_g054878 [Trifolium pratense]|uniref:Uncharacterized protein n=1 Tax=Trifolium pratense TaxID=57577 RepID=A0A2K3KIE3_TRIPR|nr:hypothetical protein L195_g054878 [Trifolium pratense]